MGLDRKEPEYRAIEILMDEDLQTTLDRVMDSLPNGYVTDEQIMAAVANTPYSHSEKARIRIALWFWNGCVPIYKGDVMCLDEENRARFLAALKQHLHVF